MLLLSNIKVFVEDQVLYELLMRYVSCSIESDCRIYKKTCGILQGSPLSPLLSNLYLTGLDLWMEKQGYLFVRFADNTNIYVSDLQEGYQILEKVIVQLETYGLEMNKDKTGVFSVYSRKFLGYDFEKTINGILTRKDFTALFANEEQKTYIPVKTSDVVNVYSNVEISLTFLETLSHNQVNLNIFNQYGEYIGSFYTANQKNQMKCLVAQVEIYQNAKKRLWYAKKINMAA